MADDLDTYLVTDRVFDEKGVLIAIVGDRLPLERAYHLGLIGDYVKQPKPAARARKGPAEDRARKLVDTRKAKRV